MKAPAWITPAAIMAARLEGYDLEQATRKAVADDLLRRITELLAPLPGMVEARLHNLEVFDITGEHARGAGAYDVPRLFVAALAEVIKQEIGWQRSGERTRRNAKINRILANM